MVNHIGQTEMKGKFRNSDKIGIRETQMKKKLQQKMT